MISLQRDRKKVPAAFRGEGRDKNEQLLLDQPGPEREFNSAIWKKAKNQLKRESAGKCAYCESSTEAVAHGDVEHFRPKSVYWWLAYCYDNYSFSCQICNQTHKSDKFPVAATRLRAPTQAAIKARGLAPDPTDASAVSKWLKSIAKEKALVADPYVGDPTLLFAWEADDVLKEVAVVPRHKSGSRRAQALASIETLGLNREELLKWRHRQYAIAAAVHDVVRAAPASAQAPARALLKSLTRSDQPYAAMIRYFTADVWKLAL